MKTVFIPNGSRVLPLSMRYASLAFPTLSLLDFAISVMSLAEWSLVRKCSETVVGLEIVDGLSTDLRCSLKRSLSRRLVSPLHCLEQSLHCIMWMTFLELQSMWLKIGLVSPVAWNVYGSLSVRYVFTRWDSFFRIGMSPRAGCVVWDCEVSALTRNQWGYYYVYKLHDGCSFKDVVATGGWNKDVKVFANNGWDGTKGWVVGDNKGNTFCFVQYGSVMGCKCFCPCDIVNSLYFPLKEL